MFHTSLQAAGRIAGVVLGGSSVFRPGPRAFAGCTRLREVDLPKTLGGCVPRRGLRFLQSEFCGVESELTSQHPQNCTPSEGSLFQKAKQHFWRLSKSQVAKSRPRNAQNHLELLARVPYVSSKCPACFWGTLGCATKKHPGPLRWNSKPFLWVLVLLYRHPLTGRYWGAS